MSGEPHDASARGPTDDERHRSPVAARRFWVAALICGGLCSVLLIQPAASDPAVEPPLSGLHPVVPAVPSKLESPSLRAARASSFIERISKNDASIEVIVGQGRTLTLAGDLLTGDQETNATQPTISLGDPTVADFSITGTRHLRIIGQKVGVTDLSILTAAGETYSYEIHVVLDLKLLEARLLELVPDANVRLAHLGSKLIVEGQARDTVQVRLITDMLRRVVATTVTTETGAGGPPAGGLDAGADPATETADPTSVELINLLRVPGPQQVLLQVQVAELNRTAMRQIGSDLLWHNGHGVTMGTRLNGITTASADAFDGLIRPTINTAAASAAPTTAFGIFDGIGFSAFISALRENSVLRILAEPNLVAMHGQQARFLAGGEFPVPVPQSGAGGGPATITIQYKTFGVQLAFVPFILDDDLIRLSIDPEVSSIDFAIGTELSGVRVPGVNTRNAHTVVELREGQTLAIAGLMQLDLSGTTMRIPGLGDLPYIGPFFSNTTGQRVEKELVVLVTPYLVEAMSAEQVGPLPGEEVYEPNDLEFYLLNRITGHTGHPEFRSTTNAEDPFGCFRRMEVECRYVQGPHGFSQ